MNMQEIQEIRKLVHEELEKVGIKIPVEMKFDYSGFDGVYKDLAKKFIKLCDGKLNNTIYVLKSGVRFDDNRYFDLIFVTDESAHPICIPIPLARKLFSKEVVTGSDCKDIISGFQFESIFKHYYENRDEIPF